MKRIVIFDFDNVIIRGQSQLYLVDYLIKKRKIQFRVALQIYFWFLLKKVGFQISPARVRTIAYKTFKGWTTENFEYFFKKFNIEIIRNYCISEVHQLIKNHIESKDEVVVVSATLNKIVENCLLGLNVSCFITTELEIINNKYTGAVKGKVPYAQDKCLLIEDYLKKSNYDLKCCVAYTDDFTDLDLLNSVFLPIVINPDLKLRKIAIKKGWKVYDF